MTNSLAIAAVTTTLKNLLVAGFADVSDMGVIKFSVMPPDRARTNDSENQVNLFLYHVAYNGAWRNMPELRRKGLPGEHAEPPLALDLYYIISVYGTANDFPDPSSHRLLGKAMSVFHDHPVLSAAEIEAALSDAELHEQVERIRITPHCLTSDEMMKLWTGFQTSFRIAAAYQVSVVLIESTRPRRTPLPVLTVGENDRGVFVQPDMTPPLPTILVLTLPLHKTTAEPGDVLTLRGVHLSGTAVEVRFTHPRLSVPLVRSPEGDSTDTVLRVKVPDVADDAGAPAAWPPGFYRVSVAVTDGGSTRVTNEQAFALSPRIESRSPANHAPGNVPVHVTCRPQVRPEQEVALLFNDRVVKPDPFVIPAGVSDPSSLDFQIIGATPSLYTLRLRVDGVDSNPVKFSGTPALPFFDPAQQVSVP